jgi:methionyl-tRNA formyltransferase
MPLRVVFMGTAELACASLRALRRAPSVEVLAVVTQPDKPAGRQLQLQPSAVKQVALAENLPVLQPIRAREESFIEQLAALAPDLIVVAAYGQILPAAILRLPRHGCLNVHTSLLPKYRGASPIQSALLHDEAVTGVTIMLMDAGLDTGPMLTQQTTPIAPDDNAQTLHDRLAQLGAELLVQTIPEYITGRISPQAQPAVGATHCAKIKKQDGQLDWSQPARTLWNRLRAFTPWPGVFTHLCKDGGATKLLKVWRMEITEQRGAPGEVLAADKAGLVIACGQGALRILEVQPEGARRMTAAEFLVGHPLPVGQRLGGAV